MKRGFMKNLKIVDKHLVKQKLQFCQKYTRDNITTPHASVVGNNGDQNTIPGLHEDIRLYIQQFEPDWEAAKVSMHNVTLSNEHGYCSTTLLGEITLTNYPALRLLIMYLIK